MPEDNVAFYAALIPITSSNLTVVEATTVMGKEPPKDAQEYLDYTIEAACRLRLKYAETILQLRGAA